MSINPLSTGLNLLVTPMKAIGRIVRSDGNYWGRRDEKFYIAVRLRVQNIGNISWRPEREYPEADFGVFADESFGFFPDESTADGGFARPIRLLSSGCYRPLTVWWEKFPKLPQRISPGETVIGWLTFCVEHSDWLSPRINAREVKGDYALYTCGVSLYNLISGCPVWPFRLE
jgi:hypothetical protein